MKRSYSEASLDGGHMSQVESVEVEVNCGDELSDEAYSWPLMVMDYLVFMCVTELLLLLS